MAPGHHNTGKISAREQHEVLMTVARAECGVGRDPEAWLSSHVFVCPNKHFYLVGSCGCPTQTGRCTECGATIGGMDHLLGPGNSLAQREVAQIRASAGARW